MVPVTTSPNLSLVEASALAAVLGRPGQVRGMRNHPATAPWLDAYFDGDVVGVIDVLVARLDEASDRGATIVGAMEFSDDDHMLMDAALTRARKSELSETTFLANYTVDRMRAAHLQMGLKRDHAATQAMATAISPEARTQAGQLLTTARVLRRDRGPQYQGVRALVMAPELNLYSDVINVAHGRTAFSVVGANADQARRMYADDLRRATERANIRTVEQASTLGR
ncbi:MAG: hypothetical protein ACOYN3_05065 [Acidimicrobiia bacterium]